MRLRFWPIRHLPQGVCRKLRDLLRPETVAVRLADSVAVLPPVAPLRVAPLLRRVAGTLALAALAGCATPGAAGVETPTTAYMVEEIERQIAGGESLSAMQRIWALESDATALVAADDLAELRNAALSSMQDELELAWQEQRYLDAAALVQSLATAGAVASSGPPAAGRSHATPWSVPDLYRREIKRLIVAGDEVSALLLGLRAIAGQPYTAADLRALRDLAERTGNARALTLLAAAAAERGLALPVPELPPPPPFAEMLGGTVTVWVDRGVELRRGVGIPDRVIGSGFFIDRRGHLLTNYHVIQSEVDPKYEGYSRLFIRLSDRDDVRVPAKVVGYDRIFDLALLKAEVEPGYVFSSAAAGALAPGDKVVAIGTPGDLSLAKTVTSGIISATGRRFLQMGDALQVDAPLNPGNSGGPLLNGSGELVGVTFAGLEQFEGINFGISYHWIQRVLPKLYRGGDTEHLWIGTSVHRDAGALVVTYVLPGSPAARAGLTSGDRLVRVAHHEVQDIVGVQRHLLGYDAPSLVEVVVQRDGRRRSLLVSLERRPFSPLEVALQRDARDHALLPLFGLGVERVGRTLLREEHRVTRVVPGSIADESRISVDDPVRIEEFGVDEASRTAYLRVLIKKRRAGYLEASVLLVALLEQNHFL